MKRIVVVLLVAVVVSTLSAQTKNFVPHTIYEIQKPSDDSLHFADSLGNLRIYKSTHWRTQASPFLDSLVEITGLVVVPPRMITYTAGGRTLVLTDVDTNSGKPWSYIFVRYMRRSGLAAGEVDVLSENTFDLNGYNTVKQGDIVKIRGKILEFGSDVAAMTSYTQLEPDIEEAVEILDNDVALPPPIPVTIEDFKSKDGKVKFSIGESYEAARVFLTNLKAGPQVSSGSNTDATFYFYNQPNLNTMSTYDWSYNYSKRNGDEGKLPEPVIPLPPTEGRIIDTLTGFISTSSGTNASLSYRLCPVFPGDIKLGVVLPSLYSHRRTPIVVAVDSTPRVSVKIYAPADIVISGRKLVYSVNDGAWTEIDMPIPGSDTISTVTIPAQSANSVVKYFLKVIDGNGKEVMLANSNTTMQRDTSKGFFTYKVFDRTAKPVLSIQDVQYTPYLHGYSPYVAAIDSVGGIITADTSCILRSPLSVNGATVYYMQSTNVPFSGLWFTAPDSIAAKVRLGDSVIVTGTISEFADVTNLFNVKSVRIVSNNNPLPSPVKLMTEVFGLSAVNGDPVAEQYEGMLVQFDNAAVTDIIPFVVGTGQYDYYQYELSNSGQAIMVMRDGINHYSSAPTDSTLPGVKMLRVGTQLKSLIGVLHYANKRFKVVPRTDADYSILTGVLVDKVNAVPAEYSLTQNYPNPFNPATTIKYTLPVGSKVSLKIYNVIGQEVMTLVQQFQGTGSYSVRFDASNLASGMYLYRLSAGEFTQIKKMLLVK